MIPRKWANGLQKKNSSSQNLDMRMRNEGCGGDDISSHLIRRSQDHFAFIRPHLIGCNVLLQRHSFWVDIWNLCQTSCSRSVMKENGFQNHGALCPTWLNRSAVFCHVAQGAAGFSVKKNRRKVDRPQHHHVDKLNKLEAHDIFGCYVSHVESKI